jgi:predicted outer membrane protein
MRIRSAAVVLPFLCSLVGCNRPDGENGPVTDPFGDPQVAGLAVVLTDHQVQVGMEALSLGLKSPDVRDYATRVVAEQTGARDRLTAVAAAQGIAIDDKTTEAKANQTDTMMDVMHMQPDGPYIQDSQHDMGKAIMIWNNTLLPNVHNAALRAELEATLPLLQASFDEATQILMEQGIPVKP